MKNKSVYDPGFHRPEVELRFANAALLNAAIEFTGNPSSDLFQQMNTEVENVVRLRKEQPAIVLSHGSAVLEAEDN